METSNIIFDKNIFEKACEYLKQFNKVLILTSPIPRDQYLQRFANVLNENKITSWAYSLGSHLICDNDAILKTCAKVKGADIIVALGTGTIADIAKLSAKKLNLPYCVMPTAITHYGIFNDVALLNNNGIVEIIKTEKPSRVFLDENIIKKSPERFITSTLSFALSLLEQHFALSAQRKLFGECETDLNLFLEKIKKIEELVNWIALSKDFALLNLMDYIIDISNICEEQHISNSIMYASMLNCSTLKNNFGEKCLLTSTILLKVYNSFFNQNVIIIKNIPEIEKVMKIYGKISKNNVFFEEYIKKTQFYLGKDIQNKINGQNGLLPILISSQLLISKFANKLSALKADAQNLRMIDENELFSALEILPFIHNNHLLNILTRYGCLNVI